jgi:hypothetical protein
MAWYTDMSIYHYLKWGSEAEKMKRESGAVSKSQNATDQYPRPTQEAEKQYRPFQRVLPRRAAPPKLTQDLSYEPVPNKKPQKNIAYNMAKKKD